jgi:hypothetical protein
VATLLGVVLGICLGHGIWLFIRYFYLDDGIKIGHREI